MCSRRPISLIAGASTLFVETLEKMIGRLPGSQQKQIIRRYDFSPEEKPWLFAAIDLLAYPSGYESFGISFVEAWACKKPVIGGRRGAVASLTTGGRDSLLIKHQVHQDLAEAIILLLTNPDWASDWERPDFKKPPPVITGRKLPGDIGNFTSRSAPIELFLSVIDNFCLLSLHLFSWLKIII